MSDPTSEITRLKDRVSALETALAVSNVQYNSIREKLETIESLLSRINMLFLSALATALVSAVLAILFGGIVVG